MSQLDLIRNRDDRRRARTVAENFTANLGDGNKDQIDSFVISALADLRRSGSHVTEETLFERTRLAMTGDSPLETSGESQIYQAARDPLDPLIPSKGDGFVAENRSDLSEGEGRIGPEVSRVSNERPINQDTSFGDALTDTAGALIWHTLDSLSVGLLDLGLKKIGQSDAIGEDSFLSGVINAAENMKRADTEAGKYGEGIGEGLGIIIPFLASGGLAGIAKAGFAGAGGASRVAGQIGRLAPANLAFGAGRKLVTKAATRGAKQAVKGSVGEVAEAATKKGISRLSRVDESLEGLSNLRAKREELTALVRGGTLKGKELVKAKQSLNRLERSIASKAVEMGKAVGGGEIESMARAFRSGSSTLKVDEAGDVIRLVSKASTKAVDEAVEVVYNTRKGMTAEAIKGATGKILRNDAEKVFKGRLERALKKEITDPALRKSIIDEASKDLSKLVTEHGSVRHLGEIFAKSPILGSVSERVGKIIQNFGEEAIGFAVHGAMHRFTEAIGEVDDIEAEDVADSLHAAVSADALKGDARTAFIFSTGGGVIMGGFSGAIGFLPMKAILPGRHHESLGKAMNKMFGGGVDKYKPMYEDFSSALGERIGNAKRIGRIKALLNRKGSRLDPSRLMHAAELDYRALAKNDPEALYLIARKMQNLGNNAAVAEIEGVSRLFGSGKSTSHVEAMRQWVEKYVNGSPAVKKHLLKNKPKAFTETADALQGMAESVVAKDRAILMKTFGKDLIKNLATGMSIAFSGNPFVDQDGDGVGDSDLSHMIDGINNGTMHASNLIPHLAFSMMSASHPLYTHGMGNFMLSEKTLEVAGIEKPVTMTEMKLAEQQIAFQKRALGMGDDRLFLSFQEKPNEITSVFETPKDREVSSSILNEVLDTIDTMDSVLVHNSAIQAESNMKKAGLSSRDWKKQASVSEAITMFNFMMERKNSGMAMGEMAKVLESDPFMEKPETIDMMAKAAVVAKNFLTENGYVKSDPQSFELNKGHILNATGEFTSELVKNVASFTQQSISSVIDIIGDPTAGNRKTDISQINVDLSKEEVTKLINDTSELSGDIKSEKGADIVFADLRTKVNNLVDLGYITGQFTQGSGMRTIKTAEEFKSLVESVATFENALGSKMNGLPHGVDNVDLLNLSNRNLFAAVSDGIYTGAGHAGKAMIVDKMNVPVNTADGGTAHVNFDTVLDQLKEIGIIRQEGRDNRFSYGRFDERSIEHLTSDNKKRFVRNLMKTLGSLPYSRASKSFDLTPEMASKIAEGTGNANMFKDVNGENIMMRDGVYGIMNEMNIRLQDPSFAREALRHIIHSRAAGLSPVSYALFDEARNLGLVTESANFGTTLNIPMVSDINVTNPGELRTALERIIKEAHESGDLLGSGTRIDAETLSLLEPYVREWKKAGLLDATSTGENGMIPEGGTYSVFSGGIAQQKFMRFKRILDSLQMQKWNEDSGAMRQIISTMQKLERDPKYREELGFSNFDRNVPFVSERIIRMMGSGSPFAYGRVRDALLESGIITKGVDESLRFSPEAVRLKAYDKLYSNIDSIMFSDDMAQDLVKFRKNRIEAESQLDRSDKDLWNGDNHTTNSLTTFYADVNKAGDRVFAEDFSKAVKKSYKKVNDLPAAMNQILKSLGVEKSIDPNRLIGIANAVVETRHIDMYKMGDFRESLDVAPGEQARYGSDSLAFTFGRERGPISNGYITRMMDNFGHEIALLNNIANSAGTKIDLLSKSEEAISARAEVEKLFGEAIVVDTSNGISSAAPSEGRRFHVPTYFGDMSSMVIHKLPVNGEHTRFAGNIMKMLERNGYVTDGATSKNLPKYLSDVVSGSLKALKAINESDGANSLEKAYLNNRENIRGMMYLTSIHSAFGREGTMELLRKSGTDADIGKEISRYRQAHARSSTPTNADIFESVMSRRSDFMNISKSTVMKDGKRHLKVLVVDDSHTAPGESVSRADSNVFTRKWLLDAQANTHGFEGAGVLKNSIGMFGDENVMITKQAGAYNETMERWMADNDIAMVVTKSAAKLAFGEAGIVEDFGGRDFLKVARSGEAIDSKKVIAIPVSSMKLGKVPHKKSATVSYPIENWVSDVVAGDLSAMYRDGFSRSEALWGKLLAEDTPESRVMLRDLATQELQRHFDNDPMFSIEQLKDIPLMEEYLAASKHGSPMDMSFANNFLGVMKRRLIHENIFKMSSESGHQMVLGVDAREVLNSGESMASFASRDLVIQPRNTVMAINVNDPARAETDMRDWGGWKKESHYNKNPEMGETGVIYRDLMKKMGSGKVRADGEGFVYRMLKEQIDGRHRKGVDGDQSSLFSGLDAAKSDALARKINNSVVEAIEGKTKKEVADSYVGSGFGEKRIDKILELVESIVGENAGNRFSTLGGLHDGFSKAFGEYKYESRDLEHDNGLTATSWGIVGINQRYPSARPNDTIPSVFMGFLNEKYGNQYILNWNDAVRKGEADYDIDTFNYWFDAPRGMVAEFARIRNISPVVNTPKPYTFFADRRGKRGMNPFSHKDNERYTMDQAESARLRGSVIKSGKIVEKMVTDQIGVEYTDPAGNSVKVVPKYKSQSEALEVGQKDIMYISQMVQEIVDSKSGILPSSKRAESDIFYGMDPFATVSERFFVAEVTDRHGVTETRAIKPKEADYLRRAMLPYAKLLRMSKSSWEGDAAKSMTHDEMVQIVSEYVDSALESGAYSKNYEQNMTTRLRSVMPRGDGAIDNIRFISNNPTVGMNERAAGQIMRLAALRDRGSHMGWTPAEDVSVRGFADQIMSEGGDIDVATRIQTEKALTFGEYKKASKSYRDEIASQLSNARFKAGMGSKSSAIEAEQLSARLRYANKMYEASLTQTDGLLEIKFDKKNGEVERRKAIQNSNGATAVKLAKLDIPVSPEYVSNMNEAAAEIRGVRGSLYVRKFNDYGEGLGKVYDTDITRRLESLVDKYMRTFASVGLEGNYDADLAILSLISPDAVGIAKMGSRNLTVYKNVPSDLLGIAIKHPLVSQGVRIRVLNSLGKANAIVSGYASGDIASAVQISEYVQRSAEAKFEGRLRDRIDIAEKMGIASIRTKSLHAISSIDPNIQGMLFSDNSGKSVVAGIDFGAVPKAFESTPDLSVRRLNMKASMKFTTAGERATTYGQLLAEIAGEKGGSGHAATVVTMDKDAVRSKFINSARRQAEANIKAEADSKNKEFDVTSPDVKSKIQSETMNVLARLADIAINGAPGNAEGIKSVVIEGSDPTKFYREQRRSACR